MNFPDWPWRYWREQRGDQPALRSDQHTPSWQQLCAEVDALASGFARQGVGAGDGVMLRARNQPQTVLAWLALLQCGARVLPINPQLPAALLDALLPAMTLRFALDLTPAPLAHEFIPLRCAQAPGEHAVEWQPQRLASMTLTSGSTGLPKAAVHTFAAHLASAQGVLALIPFNAEDDWLLSLPLFHVSGQGILWRWLLAGGRMTVHDKLPLDQALRGCSHASLVPTQLWRLLN